MISNYYTIFTLLLSHVLGKGKHQHILNTFKYQISVVFKN